MAATMTPSWNPLRLGNTPLPVPLLLSAKLIVVTLLATGHVWTLPDPFLPFLSVFDRIGDPVRFRTALQILFLAGSASLIFNRGVRLASFVVGATVLVGIASSRIYWANNTFFCGAILTLIGLYASKRSVWLVRAQIALIYLGAGLNKALDPDWLSGQFFEHWTVVNLEHDLYTRVAALLPPMALSKFMGWATIATELSLFVGFIVPRWWPLAIWLGILFHASMTVFTGITFVLFLYVAPAAYLAFAGWPAATTEVIYDGRLWNLREDETVVRDPRSRRRLSLDRVPEWNRRPLRHLPGRPRESFAHRHRRRAHRSRLPRVQVDAALQPSHPFGHARRSPELALGTRVGAQPRDRRHDRVLLSRLRPRRPGGVRPRCAQSEPHRSRADLRRRMRRRERVRSLAVAPERRQPAWRAGKGPPPASRPAQPAKGGRRQEPPVPSWRPQIGLLRHVPVQPTPLLRHVHPADPATATWSRPADPATATCSPRRPRYCDMFTRQIGLLRHVHPADRATATCSHPADPATATCSPDRSGYCDMFLPSRPRYCDMFTPQIGLLRHVHSADRSTATCSRPTDPATATCSPAQIGLVRHVRAQPTPLLRHVHPADRATATCSRPADPATATCPSPADSSGTACLGSGVAP